MWHNNPHLLALQARIRQEQFLREAEMERLYQQAKDARRQRKHRKERPIHHHLTLLARRLAHQK